MFYNFVFYFPNVNTFKQQGLKKYSHKIRFTVLNLTLYYNDNLQLENKAVADQFSYERFIVNLSMDSLFKSCLHTLRTPGIYKYRKYYT